MNKNFRNLILSLFLAAGAAVLAACDGTTGPAGVAGDTGVAGPAGAAGDAGKAGDSADEVLRSYAYLKTWGKAEGKAACSDPVLKSPDDAFPGPAALKMLTPVPTAGQPANMVSNNSELGTPGVKADEGKCSNAVYASPALSFKLTHGDATNNMTETPRKGTTPTLRNRTLTEIKKEFREGEATVTFNANASEPGERDLVFTRCDIPNGLSGSTLKGRYRVVKITEDEYLLKTNTDTTTEKDTGTGSKVTKTTVKVCVRFSAPGTVKCYIRERAEKRKTSDDQKAPSSEDVTTEQIVLYKDGKLTQVDPMPDKTNLVPGTTPGLDTDFFGPSSNFFAIMGFIPAKLCNFFKDGVVGTKAAAPSAASPAQIACETDSIGTSRGRGDWDETTNPPCTCRQDSELVTNQQDPNRGQCRCPSRTPVWNGSACVSPSAISPR